MSSVDGYPPASAKRRVGIGAAVVVAILALTVTIGIGIFRGANAPTETVRTDTAEATTVEAAPVYVHVAGEVVVPGMYRLREGARVVDAIAAAGGFTPHADRDAVNLARAIGDGEQLVVPAQGDSPAATGAAGAAGAGGSTGDGRINLNTADAGQLDQLPRIGPAMAQRILDWRDANGRFTSVDDLLAVPGIGEKMLEALRPLVTV